MDSLEAKMTNPYIDSFIKLETNRDNDSNIFIEAKKLSAAQKRHLDKNDNDKIDSEDFELLRKEEEQIDEILRPQRSAIDAAPTPTRLTQPQIRRAGALAADAQRGRAAAAADAQRGGAAQAASQERSAAADAAQERRATPTPTPTPTPAPTAAPAPRSVPGDETAAHMGGPTGYELPTDRTRRTDGATNATPAPTSLPPLNVDNSRDRAPTPTRVRAQDVTPGMRMGRADADEITSAQRALGLTADGIAGPQTRQAIMNFQRERGLQVDGVMGDQTRTALRQLVASQERDRRNAPNMMADSFSPAELEHIKSIVEAMPVAPTSSDSSPNPTPKNKAEGSRSKGSLAD